MRLNQRGGMRWQRRRCIRDFCVSSLPSPAPILPQDRSWGNTPAADDGHALSEAANQIGWKLDFFRVENWRMNSHNAHPSGCICEKPCRACR
jgi:hypothetical protein